IGERRRRGVAVLSTRKEVPLEREVRKGMADDEREKKDQGRRQTDGGGERQGLKFEHATVGFAATEGGMGDDQPGTSGSGSEGIEHGLPCHGDFLVRLAKTLAQLSGHI